MHIVLRILFAIFLCQFPLATPALAHPQEAALKALVDSYAKRRGFNGTVLVARRGQILVRVSYGLADIGRNEPGNPELKYRIGSLTKPFTATLVMQLVEQGRLRLDGTLSDYLPDLYGETAAAPVTIAQLLSHTSGIADVPARYDDPWWQTSAREQWAQLDFTRRWIQPELVETPGAKYRYNNNGFFLLGLIIERVTGRSFAENLQARIFRPAGMSASGLFAGNTDRRGFASGYAVAPAGTPSAAAVIDPSVSFSAAGIYSTADDILQFDRALYGTRLVNAGSRATMFRAHTKFYGFGWGVDEYPLPGGKTLSVLSHTGSIPGYQSYYLRSEAEQDCVIILDNFWQGALVSQMGRDLIEVLNGKPMQLALYSLDDLLVPIAYNQGVEAMVAAYAGLGQRQAEYDLSERAFNALGYKLLRGNQVVGAIEVFRWGTQRYPNSANTHDSLGEAYRTAGRAPEAIESYKNALALDPNSESAKTALSQLQPSAAQPPR